MSTVNNSKNALVFDIGPEEPMLCMLRGYDDCETCYYRLSTINRLTQGVKQLHREV